MTSVTSSEILAKLAVFLEDTELVSEIEKEMMCSNKLEVLDYSEKSIAVFGNSTSVKEELKKMGGKYNANLKNNGETAPGWIFSNSKKDAVTKFIDDLNSMCVVKLTLKKKNVV